MERNKFDLIIPVVYKDYGMLDRVLQYVVKYISPDNIYIITDARYRKYLPKEARRMEVVDEPRKTVHDTRSSPSETAFFKPSKVVTMRLYFCAKPICALVVAS